MKVLFRSSYVIAPFRLEEHEGAEIGLRLMTPRRMSVTIVNASENHDRTSSIARASCEIEPNRHVATGLDAIARGELPAHSTEPLIAHWKRVCDENGGRYPPNHVLPEAGLPEGLKSFVVAVHHDLEAGVRRACRALRWRLNLIGSHNPIHAAERPAEFSLDGLSWIPVPRNTYIGIYGLEFIRADAGLTSEIQQILDVGSEEPVAHQLFREASEQYRTNRRSALVIAVAALEVAAKTYLASAAPDSEWLLENTQSPPVAQMLQEYLPTLPAKQAINGAVQPPPANHLREIRAAVHARNRLVHRGSAELDLQSLKSKLAAIADVLWLLDYYSGADWAQAHFSDELREGLGLLALPQEPTGSWVKFAARIPGEP